MIRGQTCDIFSFRLYMGPGNQIQIVRLVQQRLPLRSHLIGPGSFRSQTGPHIAHAAHPNLELLVLLPKPGVLQVPTVSPGLPLPLAWLTCSSQGLRDGSANKGICSQTPQPEFNPTDPYREGESRINKLNVI